jgi:hypothetical protein
VSRARDPPDRAHQLPVQATRNLPCTANRKGSITMRPPRLLAWLPGLALAAALLAPTAVHATETQTYHVSGTGTEPQLLNPCSGTTGTLTFAYQGVTHITELDSGLFQAAGSTTGTWSLLPDDPTQPSYTGHTVSSSEQTFLNFTSGWTVTSTVHVILHGSDGSLLKLRALSHVTANPDGTVTSYIDVDEVSCL